MITMIKMTKLWPNPMCSYDKTFASIVLGNDGYDEIS